MLDDAVVSTGAPDERLDISAALDQGRRLFFLRARYQDPGNGQADYYLAGPQGVSHQPLRALFAPLGAWLAAPGHEHEMVLLGLSTDPRSANPVRFDAACQALTTALGPYLLKASDLPAGKAWGELAPDELGALESRPHVITDWSACTGEEPPLARPQAQPASPTTSYEHWMADQADVFGQRPLRQVVIPGSHDAATYGGWRPIVQLYAQAQSLDITAQLNAGSRYFDLRFTCYDWATGPGQPPGICRANSVNGDYYVNHGEAVSTTVTMASVLNAISDWVDQPSHEREIVVLTIDVGSQYGINPGRLADICRTSLHREVDAGHVLQPSLATPGGPLYTTLYDMSLNELWALPGQPRIIVTGWDDCTGDPWPPPPPGSASTPVAGYYADTCFLYPSRVRIWSDW